jgi:chromosome segregation protein
MDGGAHFHKSDFQVHTPRDLNWQGSGAITNSERRDYAVEFVAACRAKGLQALAITDHHDVAFFRYIREAAFSETDDGGRPMPTQDRLVVFPGLELTLGIPCQALLLFDANLPVEFLPLALTALGITPSDDAAEKHAAVKKLDIMSFDDLYAALNKLEPLRDRFIAFPHVGDGGYKTLLRKDFEKHYISMPCVGGYVDGPLPEPPKATGMRTITNGQDKNWGNKPLGVFQTSDSRSRDFDALGKHVTWVKWARPTAEALRQACLARHSRITHGEPTLPSIQITRVEVSNSKFLGPFALDFNPQYNAVIGGRGTGKSTILEYIRWALCDQPLSSDSSSAELADFQRRRQALIEGTLLALDAVVDVSFLLNGVSHIVRRKATGELTLKIGDALFQACTEQNVRELLPIRAYSQKQLSAVGARLEELRRFVHAPIQADLDSLTERIAELGGDLRVAYDRVIRYRALREEIESHEIERRSLEEQIGTLRSRLKGLSAEDSAVIARQGVYEAEQRVVQALARDADTAKEALAAVAAEFQRPRLPTPIGKGNASQNAGLLYQAHTTLGEWMVHVQRTVAGLLNTFADPVAEKSLGPYFAALAQWRERREGHRAQYEQAKTRSTAHDETLTQIQALETRLGELNESADAKAQQIGRLGDPSADFEALRTDWKSAHRERADLLQEQCLALTGISRSRLRATLRRAADIDPLAERLKELIKGTKTRGERVDNLVRQLSAALEPLETWHEILDELQGLAWVGVEDEATTQLPMAPRLDHAGFTQKEKIALARQIQPTAWLELLLFDVKDLPVFEYEVRTDDFLPFDKVSPGQQATALLSILLLQEGPPLIIDQPEDDLNMRIISEIVETLWRAKTRRQVLFSSHNANLVVNGDAELVICCDYRTRATESGGQIKLSGAIDDPEINREIAEVMEGGVEAFKLRHQKYGF